jgi:ecotin
MRQRATKVIAGTALLLACWAALSLAQTRAEDLKPFPRAAPGQQRLVIRVPGVPNPDDLRVEVMIGKTITADCNRHSFGGNVTQEEARGWGYSYYVLDALRGPASTMMACPAGTPRHEEFARVPAELLAGLRYNPKVPLVIYVPAGAQVRYRIWSAGSQTQAATPE